ncbi:MAG: ABC transporter permease [Planctomycetaceae bacterium]|nr:ABC transporter permease [Planctomycetaceae bacterium]
MKLLRLVVKNLRRRPMRTLLTVGGVACAMLMLVLVQSLGAGLDAALSGSEAARTLIVYRLNRYCPQTSFLPEWYGPRIEQLAGVTSVLPVKVYLNNCRASLDIVPFNGVPAERLAGSRKFDVLDGDYGRFLAERDAALVGRSFAERKNLAVGDQFRFGGINVKVAGIFGSSEPVEEGTVVTHLEYLQRAVAVNRLGTVTQFEVKIDDPARAKEISAQIDDLFRTAPEPTDTRPRILFLEHATRDLREILRFAELLGLACVAVVLALVANTVAMSVQERVREFGVFRTLGFHARHVAALVIGEALVLALSGGALGLGAALAVIRFSSLTIGAEGVPVSFSTQPELIVRGFAIALATGLIAGLAPAIRSSRSEIVASLRSA